MGLHLDAQFASRLNRAIELGELYGRIVVNGMSVDNRAVAQHSTAVTMPLDARRYVATVLRTKRLPAVR